MQRLGVASAACVAGRADARGNSSVDTSAVATGQSRAARFRARSIERQDELHDVFFAEIKPRAQLSKTSAAYKTERAPRF